jgi:UDP-glucose 4-epimerase
MTKCLVTGGAGFIGSNLVDELIKQGNEVITFDNESAECNEKFYWNDKSQNYKYDICDYEKTRSLYDGVDYVFHLAAESRLQPAILNPIEAITKNAVGTCTVLQCAREAGVEKVIYSSTSSAYGLNKYPNYETDPNDCLNPYSVSKVAGEELCKMYTNLYGLKTIIFRYFNVYGERSPTTGQYAPVIGIFLRQRNLGEPLTIVGDGLQRRDFVHVQDVANANIMSAISNLEDNCYGQVYNIGSGENISILEIAKMISDNCIHISPRDGEARTTLACIDKVKETLEWEPKFDLKCWIGENK